MKAKTRTLAAMALLTAAAGCQDTSATNAGLTNGPPPSVATEKPAVRTDVHSATVPDRGEATGGDATNKKDDAVNPPAKDSGAPETKPPGR